MQTAKTGQIVWHDLFTGDRDGSMAFYQKVAGWSYQVERAADFAWGGGERDFVLALSDGEAGAGLAETPAGLPGGWIPYAEVSDVDAAAALAERLGGETVRPPFEVPGVGRNALLRDPLGSLFGISLSRHGFPVPRRQFGPEVYLSNGADFPMAFYAGVCGWQLPAVQPPEQTALPIFGPSGDLVALHYTAEPLAGSRPGWVPNIKVTSPRSARDAAEALGAGWTEGFAVPNAEACEYFLIAPDGAPAALSRTGTGSP
ncbi:VOC family protein [Leisingera aquaemixtae]|uniref:VOC family protein n=1 Tax=Leisingera aquaemixtae TaxID=1396826 RepID=UPI0021A35DF4|nr:VOC family protein [Leisingera aquaemixtae]UWQ24071.1 VOC family protein [Leisingera aquaemixtae]